MLLNVAAQYRELAREVDSPKRSSVPAPENGRESILHLDAQYGAERDAPALAIVPLTREPIPYALETD